MKSTVSDLDITPLLRFLLQRNVLFPSLFFLSSHFLPPFLLLSSPNAYFHQSSYLPSTSSNLFRYSSSNFQSFHPYNNFTVYFPGNSILLYSSTSPSYHLTSTPPHSNSSINSSIFFKFSFLSHVSPSAVNSFHRIKYFTTPLIFFLFNIFSTSYSSTPSTSTGFSSSFFCPFTCSLYLTIRLTFTTR